MYFMRYQYPEPADVGIKIPAHLMKQRFRGGFLHALKGGQITEVEQLRLSFREGYRAGKLYLRHVRRKQGIIEFPFKAKLIFKTTF
jgi:hypothetical protein